MDPLTEFASQHPQIEYVTPTSPDFNTVRSIFAHPEIIPSAILRPGSIEDVAAAVSFLARDGIEFTIRAGGHDMHGRSMKNGAVALDLRRINHVHVQVDKETATARIGGGSLMADVIAELQREGFITPVGTIGQVGYVGWAMYGGYGQYSALFGLGVDQIVGAKVVNATGEIVEAGRELLKGIRGAGGAFGVVAELTVSIYKLDKVLAGVLMFKSDDLDALVPQFNEQYRALKAQGLPKPLSLNQAVIPAPTPTFGILFLWASPDIEEGNKWVDKVAGLGPVMVNTVEEKTPKSWLDEATKIVATSTQGRLYAVSLREITDEVAQIIAHYTKNTPADPHILFDVHELRRESPSINPAPGSVFAAREPHFVVQIITIVQDKENLQKTLAWGSEFQRALQETSADNIVSASYVSFTSPEEMDPSKIYGENLPFLKNLKMKVDPGNVFKAAISYL